MEGVVLGREVSPEIGNSGKDILDKLESSNDEISPCLARMALKLAAAAGKTTVVAMLNRSRSVGQARRVAMPTS
jgi:hypothetical protein